MRSITKIKNLEKNIYSNGKKKSIDEDSSNTL
jgi:hypothetical protein